jgi:hypothetical protein
MHYGSYEKADNIQDRRNKHPTERWLSKGFTYAHKFRTQISDIAYPIMDAVRGCLEYLNNLSSSKADGRILSSTFPRPAPPDFRPGELACASDEFIADDKHLDLALSAG